MTVRLISFSEPSLVGQAARACYGKTSDDELSNIALAAKLRRIKHMEPLENSHVYFECVIPKFVASQLNRHRIGIGRCQQSLRLSYAKPLFFWPDDTEITENDLAIIKASVDLIKRLASAKQREREIRQRLIPDTLMVEYRTWFNIREFLTLCERRLDRHAQIETRIVISLMRDQLMMTPWAPVLDLPEQA
jgi:thymidylate synthase ThyX